jgi:hypothetical protein
MKYRQLTSEELQYFEEDFKHFLIVNGVYNDEWKELNINESHKAIQLIELFSDQILQKVYEKIQFLEKRTLDACFVFDCIAEKEIVMFVIQAKSETSTIDLSSIEGIHDALKLKNNALSFFKTSKTYSTTRELEIHKLIQDGCIISSKDFWDSLQLIL